MKALLIVDPQNDFCEGGPLGVRGSSQIFPIINQLKKNPIFSKVFVTQDWHPANHVSFAINHNLEPFTEKQIDGQKQMLWPVHCVAGSNGAAVSPLLELNGSQIFTTKGENRDQQAYSGFGTQKNPSWLKELLTKNNIEEVLIVGLALDYCVGLTALDAKKQGFKTEVVIEGTKPVSNQTGKQMLKAMQEAGVQVISIDQITLTQ